MRSTITKDELQKPIRLKLKTRRVPENEAGHTFLQVLKTPALDFALAIGSLKPVRKFLTQVFASA